MGNLDKGPSNVNYTERNREECHTHGETPVIKPLTGPTRLEHRKKADQGYYEATNVPELSFPNSGGFVLV